MSTLSRITSQIQSSFQSFYQRSSSAGIVILSFTVIALIWTNTALHSSYEAFLHQPINLKLFSLHLEFSLEHFVNDGLMVLFFLVVGLEIKRELLIGELSSARKAALPAIAAVAGMIFPGLIFMLFNHGTPDARGWGVPVATDIAFALGILALLGKRVPIGLKVFLAALAIIDDLFAVLIIAIFYTGALNLTALTAAAVILVLLWGLNKSGSNNLGLYGILGVCLWIAILFSGIHATIAGVLLALTIPATARIDIPAFTKRGKMLLRSIDDKIEQNEDKGEQLDHIASLKQMCTDSNSVLHRLEHGLQPFVTFGIMPLFALVNAGVVFNTAVVDSQLHPVGLGIILGLFVGKQLGVSVAVWLSVRFKIAELPNLVSMKHIYGVSILCGIGFTMALFVAHLAFPAGESLDVAKLSVMAGSTASALVGSFVLRWFLKTGNGKGAQTA